MSIEYGSWGQIAIWFLLQNHDKTVTVNGGIYLNSISTSGYATNLGIFIEFIYTNGT